ncbi:MAG: adenylate/guanylate cyclase domain-containing response regulator [Oscillatoriales cyanobacterium]|uniref:Adenylate/guanylate cyclase domain-containing protein n=1 Tax=Microcoleus anatoxicus PTRS2 TaxID=2705321 RepID=A0ABU8YMJ4_9CYAN|nr:MAG: adenylate/guanylate cyclase domain-containing response regulator [Oscillatoriales cyanobacterium]TAD94714.1 MAG: adenylate/guanylate cyclase domain-containing response regulator [Oscillatoriales cyanobacterium]TAE05872.1 MAG: adenylate/guanylate cyclase domain-containing response regulator [Oscillatoriales cyanobacterium]TAE99354.1 MAG: adenylate/guanylate cyclase domain-containing response regulator [Oscillatoriales cyanobacterium]TAF42975.1 MAG: adenylate/guanylate cyclase domain-cont
MIKQVIICVDDEKTVLKSLKTELKDALGNTYRIEIAEGGEDALELIAELMEDGYEIPLIISDYVMPDMKGDELLRRVHQLSPKTLKVMLTGQATIEAVGNAIKNAKLYRYIGKPWQTEDLKLTVTEAVHSYSQDKKLAAQNAELWNINQELEFALEQQSKLTEAAKRFVPNEFVSLLSRDTLSDVKLGDSVEKEMSILFSDIRDFTALSEGMTPQENFKFINAYLSRMEPGIIENHGFIDKYIGDAIMALFGHSAVDAVQAGISMLHSLDDYNQYRIHAGYGPIKIGIGINTGSLMLGTVGATNRMDSTVIGDAVNLAARVESLTKSYGVSMLITQNTFSKLTNFPRDFIRNIGHVRVKGKSNLVTIYEVFEADKPEGKEGKARTLSIFREALYNYSASKHKEAAQLFGECLQQNPLDRVAQNYLERCQEMQSILLQNRGEFI